MTAVLERAPAIGDRVNCGRVGGWLSLIGQVVDVCDVTGDLQVREESTGLLVNVRPTVALVMAPPQRRAVQCPTCGNDLPGLLATCRKPACLAADLDAEMTEVRRADA